MKAQAFAIIPHSKGKGTTIELECLPLTLCTDCKYKECEGREGFIVCGITGESHPKAWFCADGEQE